MPPIWLTALLAGVLIGVLVWQWNRAGVHDEHERTQRRSQLDDHEHRLRVIEDYLVRLLGYEPPEDDEWTN